MKVIDFLIVGQGLAGTLLAHYLLKENCTLHLIDNHFKAAASKVAAGIINPITGRRIVKSWKIDELIPFAENCYQEIETKLDISIFKSRNILRVIKNIKDENLWISKSAFYDLEHYIQEDAVIGNYKDQLKEVFSYGEITHSAQVDVASMIESYRNYFLNKEILHSEAFDFEQMELVEDAVLYKGLKFKKVIFCEGHAARWNPYFDFIPFEAAKGEMLIVHIPNSDFEKILKHGLFIVPLEKKDHYWVGSTYEWEFENDHITQEARIDIETRLRKILKLPFETIDHFAGIRPTVKDRRPFVGMHPKIPSLGFFNGLGTKGTSLAPFWAKHFVEHLFRNTSLNLEVNIERVFNK